MSYIGLINTTIGTIIKEYRKRNNLTQKEMALKVECGQQHISDIERGVKNPSLKMLIDICIALNIEPSNLVLEFETEAYEELKRLKQRKKK